MLNSTLSKKSSVIWEEREEKTQKRVPARTTRVGALHSKQRHYNTVTTTLRIQTVKKVKKQSQKWTSTSISKWFYMPKSKSVSSRKRCHITLQKTTTTASEAVLHDGFQLFDIWTSQPWTLSAIEWVEPLQTTNKRPDDQEVSRTQQPQLKSPPET